ncbi:transcription factor bHLH110-like [Chenopodium quinoa]|uniref:transcription factor bHLH110-like n=1 Tax=Chenopodium quinoa TaxID=63459 RepID=UPI000B7707EB|nr:transcription factor bHLH110-like [Chenopodium quinoa]
MDSTNFQHHEQQQQQEQQQHLQDHFVNCSPLNIPSSGYGVSSSLHPWNANILPTSTTSTNTTFNDKPYENEFLSSTTSISSMPKIEDDMLSSFPTYGGLIHNPTTATTLDNINPWSFTGLISSASGMPYSRGLMQLPLEVNNWSNNNQGYPSTSFLNQLGLVSSPNNSTASTVSSSSPRLGLNLQAMDFLGSNSSFGSQNRPMSYDVVGEEVISPVGKIMSNKTSSLMNGSLTGTKRAAGSSSCDQSKASASNNPVATKKSQAKVSCPPFKVRKEKLGERIAALHQLVSPFGKTDTASVLTEAIGYIQFLQDQIHTLCMPHAKPSRSKPTRPFQMGLGSEEEGKEEERIELRRRGLCLVPYSWTSYLTPTQVDASNHPSFF